MLGCGPIAQVAHLDAIAKTRNVELHAICDVAADLRERMALLHRPRHVHASLDDMLADAELDAVLIGVADPSQVSLAATVLEAGKHVLVEKPLGVSIEECESLRTLVDRSGRVLQVGNNRRFDPGVAFARRFIEDELGQLTAFKAWYCDSSYRYTMTDNLQPLVEQSAAAHRPKGRQAPVLPPDPRQPPRRHCAPSGGRHRGRSGPPQRRQRRLHVVRGHDLRQRNPRPPRPHHSRPRRLRRRLSHLRRARQHQCPMHLPWFHKAGHVECFSARDRTYHRPLGEDAHTYKLQLESFADTILHSLPQQGATIDDGIAAMRALVAIACSTACGETVALSDATGTV